MINKDKNIVLFMIMLFVFICISVIFNYTLYSFSSESFDLFYKCFGVISFSMFIVYWLNRLYWYLCD